MASSTEPAWFTKQCRRCSLFKPLDEFSRAFGKTHWCHGCNEARRQLKQQTPEERRRQARDARLQAKYGISLEEFEAIFEEQGRACAVCRSLDPGVKGWVVDHDHETEYMRGILCSTCNCGLGLLGDTVEGVEAALNYLRRADALIRGR